MRDSHPQRRGTISPFLLVALTTLLGFFALAVNKSWLVSVREELRTAADAAALAAAQDLVSDDMLRGDMSLYPTVLDRATTTAATYSKHNTVRSRRLELRENFDNPKAGDVLFGVLTTPLGRDFVTVANRSTAQSEQARANTVVIVGRQSGLRGTAAGLTFGAFFGTTQAEMAALSVATLDRGIRGFRPRNQATPLAPIALLSDPTGTDPKSWEYSVEARKGPNTFKRDTSTNGFVTGNGDGLHEFVVTLAGNTDQLSVANAALAYIGVEDVGELAELLVTGYTAIDLAQYGGRFVLPEEDSAKINGKNIVSSNTSDDRQTLFESLDGLRQSGVVRIWPLYVSASSNELEISGFVAARVVSVTQPLPDQPLQFTLKPTMINRPDALTDTDLRGRTATMNGNPYICKIRRVE